MKAGSQSFRFSANAVLLIRSLPPGEEGLARRAAEDLRTASAAAGSLPFEDHAVTSFSDLQILLTQVERRFLKTGFLPILHFDMHGCRAGLEFSDGTLLPWENLVDRLIRLNGVMRMNLVMSLGVCEGAWAIVGLKRVDRSPFALLLAPPIPVRAAEVDAWTRSLFQSVIARHSLTDALRLANARLGDLSRFEPITFRELFDLAFNGYVDDHCDRAALRSRAARILRGLRRSGIGVALSGHALSQAVEQLKLTRSGVEMMWKNFAWHDLGDDVSIRTPFQGLANIKYSRRLKFGKTRKRQLCKNRRGDYMYGRLVGHVLELHEKQRPEVFWDMVPAI